MVRVTERGEKKHHHIKREFRHFLHCLNKCPPNNLNSNVRQKSMNPMANLTCKNNFKRKERFDDDVESKNTICFPRELQQQKKMTFSPLERGWIDFWVDGLSSTLPCCMPGQKSGCAQSFVVGPLKDFHHNTNSFLLSIFFQFYMRTNKQTDRQTIHFQVQDKAKKFFLLI